MGRNSCAAVTTNVCHESEQCTRVPFTCTYHGYHKCSFFGPKHYLNTIVSTFLQGIAEHLSRHTSATMMLMTRTTTNLHVLDGGIAWVYCMIILD